MKHSESIGSLGANIRTARKAANMSQKELSSNIGVSKNYISQLENARRSPSLSTLKKIATEVGVSPKSLMLGEPLLDELQSLISKFGAENVHHQLQRLIN